MSTRPPKSVPPPEDRARQEAERILIRAYLRTADSARYPLTLALSPGEPRRLLKP
jgi:hypothetical protein